MLCLSSLGVAIYTVTKVYYLTTSVYILISAVAGAYVCITGNDLISMSYLKPIYWNSWIMFAIFGCLQYFLGAGILLGAMQRDREMLILPISVYILCAIAFLIDVCCILW